MCRSSPTSRPFSDRSTAYGPGILALPQEAERVAVLAGDQPFVTSAALNQLCAAIGGGEAAAYVRDGQLQFLCAVWDGAALRRRLATAGSSMRSLYAAATVVEVADRAGVSRDVDTPADLAAVRRLVRDPVEAGIDIAPIAPGEGDQRQPKRGGRLHGE
ncbi:MAG: NTP transferase domain-containing protein [Tetrasphaera sp.]